MSSKDMVAVNCGSGGKAGCAVTGGSLVKFPWLQCRGILEQDIEAQIAPDELVSTLHGSFFHQCMNKCVNVTIVGKNFEWSVDWISTILMQLLHSPF